MWGYPQWGMTPERVPVGGVPETSAKDWEAELQGLAGRSTSQSIVTWPGQL